MNKNHFALRACFGMCAVLYLLGVNAHASPRPEFYCDVPKEEGIVLDQMPVPASANGEKFIFNGGIYYLNDQDITLEAYPLEYGFSKLTRAQSGSGVLYKSHNISFHMKGDQGVFILPDGTRFACQSAALKYPDAQSLFGSIIRSEPNQTAQILKKVPEGYAFTITEQTGLVYNDWQWVEVEFEEFTYGYVWGGTICTTEYAVPGVHFGC